MVKHHVYRFYAELEDVNPKIWRRFEIDGNKTVAEFAYVLMIMFEMQASHLFCIKEDTRQFWADFMQENYTSEEIEKKLNGEEDGHLYEDVRYEFSFGEEVYLNEHERLVEPNLIKLHQIIGTLGTPKLTFVYDYGDNWKVKLVLESYERKEVSLKHLPHVLEGKGYGIVENVGGTYALERLYEILKAPKDSEYESYTQWLDSTTLDLTEFGREDVNFRIKKLLRVYRDIYEYEIPPTKKSEDLLLRHYKNKGTKNY